MGRGGMTLKGEEQTGYPPLWVVTPPEMITVEKSKFENLGFMV